MRITRQVLSARAVGFAWWSLGMIATNGLSVAIYPSMRQQSGLDDILNNLPEVLRKMTGADPRISFLSPPGYLNSRVFSIMLPALLAVYAVGLAARSIAGHEEDGTLEYLLTQPVSRRRVYAEESLAMILLVVGLTLVSLVSLLVLDPLVGLDTDVPIGRLVAAHGAALAMVLAHAGIACLLGGIGARRAVAAAGAGGLAVAGFLIHGLLPLSDVLRPARYLLPWHWYADHNLLVDPVPLPASLGVTAMALIGIFGGLAAFTRRDLR